MIVWFLYGKQTKDNLIHMWHVAACSSITDRNKCKENIDRISFSDIVHKNTCHYINSVSENTCIKNDK